MSDGKKIEFVRVDPRISEITTMIHTLDRYMGELYPAESNHLVDVDTLAQPHVHFFGIKLDGEYVGCGAIIEQGLEYTEVKRIYVDPVARGLGLGRMIIDKLVAETNALGIPMLRLETGILQPEALGLFEVCGFRRCGSFGDYPADDPYSVFMERKVSL
ncbi:MAG: GNAT family N-acetyltransferase [Aestuariivirga sp.]